VQPSSSGAPGCGAAPRRAPLGALVNGTSGGQAARAPHAPAASSAARRTGTVSIRSSAATESPAFLDIDAADGDNPMAVTEYIKDIHRNLRAAESSHLASASYMEKQVGALLCLCVPRYACCAPRASAAADTRAPLLAPPACPAGLLLLQPNINEKMRAILVDWLVEVHLKFKLMPETLYLTVNLIDRFLEKEQIMRNKLQLVGVTAMFMASKYEEIYAPECRDFVYISDKAYTRDEILRMEGLMLARLNFQLTAPNAFVFVKRFAKVAGIATTPRSTTELLANYLVELTLQDYKMLKYLPSTICASAVYLALKTRGKTPWTPDLEKHSTYKEADLQACVRDIHELHDKATTNSLQAVRKKYTQEKHGNVSSIAPAHLGF
jgi:cyclin B